MDSTYHLDAEGKRHLKGHCNGESLWLKREMNDVLADIWTGTCSGCGISIPAEVWSHTPGEMDDPHEMCVTSG